MPGTLLLLLLLSSAAAYFARQTMETQPQLCSLSLCASLGELLSLLLLRLLSAMVVARLSMMMVRR